MASGACSDTFCASVLTRAARAALRSAAILATMPPSSDALGKLTATIRLQFSVLVVSIRRGSARCRNWAFVSSAGRAMLALARLLHVEQHPRWQRVQRSFLEQRLELRFSGRNRITGAVALAPEGLEHPAEVRALLVADKLGRRFAALVRGRCVVVDAYYDEAAQAPYTAFFNSTPKGAPWVISQSSQCLIDDRLIARPLLLRFALSPCHHNRRETNGHRCGSLRCRLGRPTTTSTTWRADFAAMPSRAASALNGRDPTCFLKGELL